MILAWKIKGPHYLVAYKRDGLHYLRITNTTLLVYGRTLAEASYEMQKMLDTLQENMNTNIFRKDSFFEKMACFVGVINRFFLNFLHRLIGGEML